MLFSFCFTSNLLRIKKKKKKCAEDSVAVLGHHKRTFPRLFTHLSLSNTLRPTKDPNCARNVLLFGPLFISGKVLQSWFTYEDSRENYFLMLRWFRNHGKTDLDSGPLADAMLQSTRSQEQKLPIERPLLFKIACISLKQVHIKRILLVSPI